MKVAIFWYCCRVFGLDYIRCIYKEKVRKRPMEIGEIFLLEFLNALRASSYCLGRYKQKEDIVDFIVIPMKKKRRM